MIRRYSPLIHSFTHPPTRPPTHPPAHRTGPPTVPARPPHPQVHQDVLPPALLDAVASFVIEYSKRPGTNSGTGKATCYAPLDKPKHAHVPRNVVEEVVAYLAESVVVPEVEWEGVDWWVQVRPTQSPKVCHAVLHPRFATPHCTAPYPFPAAPTPRSPCNPHIDST